MKYRKDKKGNSIDIDKAEKEVMEAINNGVNYFDTPYVYPGSENAFGEIIKRNNCRDKIYIATKLPHYMVKLKKDLEKYFNEELRRLQTNHIDYYLMHMLTDVKTWDRLKALGADEWLKEKVHNGQIHNVGFSYHGNTYI